MQRAPGPLPAHPSTPPWSPPLWLTLMILTVLATAALWSVIVVAIHWRGLTTGMTRTRSLPKNKRKNENENGWRAWIAGRIYPFAKAEVGGYTALASDVKLDDSAVALSSAHNVPARLGCPSPINPYLEAPDTRREFSSHSVRVRGSGEWAAEHRAFFLGPSSHDVSGVQSRASSSTHSVSGSEREDVESEAREAQGRRASLGRELGRFGGDEIRASWVDVGLAFVDGAVDRAAAGIVRWADDGGGDDGLVLPLVKGKSD